MCGQNTVCGVLSGARLPSVSELESLLARVAAVQGQWGRLVPAAARSLHQLRSQLVTAIGEVPVTLSVSPSAADGPMGRSRGGSGKRLPC